MKKILYILVLITFILCVDRINAYTEYKIGDVIPYNGMNFYVIKYSSSDDDTVTMLKAEPLTVDEVNLYGGVGTENNHVNMCIRTDSFYYQKAYDDGSGYGGMVYNCKYHPQVSDYTTDYAVSDIKYVVDAWSNDKFDSSGLIESRLIKIEELTNDLGYINSTNTSKTIPSSNGITPSFIYNSIYSYYTMSTFGDSNQEIWLVSSSGALINDGVTVGFKTIRPVITLKKTALGDEEENIVDGNIKKEDSKIDKKDNIDDNNTNESKTTVKVDNTYMSSSILLIILGFITASISVSIMYKLSNKKR